MTRQKVEYLIVGAGLAGLTAGQLLRKGGGAVLVLERLDLTVKNKPCTGAMPYSLFESFEKIFDRDFEHLIKQKNITAETKKRDGTKLIAPTQACTVIRKELDRQLVDCYVGAGGALKDCIRIQKIDFANNIVYCFDDRNKEKLEIAYDKLIGADGACSSVRYRLTRKAPRLSTGLVSFVKPVTSHSIFMGYKVKRSFGWYFPVGEFANIGFVYEPEPGMYSYDFLKKTFFDFAKECGVALTSYQGGITPVGNDIFLEKDNCYFAGDAAGLIRCEDFSGIEIAVQSGYTLAECLLQGKSYTNAMQSLTQELLDIYNKPSVYYMV